MERYTKIFIIGIACLLLSTALAIISFSPNFRERTVLKKDIKTQGLSSLSLNLLNDLQGYITPNATSIKFTCSVERAPVRIVLLDAQGREVYRVDIKSRGENVTGAMDVKNLGHMILMNNSTETNTWHIRFAITELERPYRLLSIPALLAFTVGLGCAIVTFPVVIINMIAKKQLKGLGRHLNL